MGKIQLNLLMLSSSRCGNENYLESAGKLILSHLSGIDHAVFIPYAGVTIGWDSYTEMVKQALPEIRIDGIHHFSDPLIAVQHAKAILVGGGNTFNLLNEIYQQNLLPQLQEKVTSGTPYVGWSAGSNICGNSIRTTNDMPIIQPPSFDALNLVPFQLNPHYSDYQPPGHNGETRAQRIAEFCQLNPDMPVIGIREGSALIRKGQHLTHCGEEDGVVFHGADTKIIRGQDDLSNYLNLGSSL